MKKRIKMLLSLSVLFVFTLVGCSAGTENSSASKGASGSTKGETRVSLATAGTGGAWYPIGGGFANVVNENSEFLRMSSEVTNGGIENIRLVSNNDSQFGFANTDAAYNGYHGHDPFEKKENVIGMFKLYQSSFQVVVPAESDIHSIADMKGKKVVVGPPASSSAIMGWNVLNAAGLKEGDVEALQISFEEGATALADGNVDVLFVMSAAPNSQILNLSATKDIRLISLDGDLQNKVVEEFGYYGKTTLAAGMYENQDADVETLSLPTMIFANADVSEEVAYEFTKMIYENLPQVHEFHAMAKDIALEEAVDIPIPMHPGAKKYFEEKGLDVE